VVPWYVPGARRAISNRRASGAILATSMLLCRAVPGGAMLTRERDGCNPLRSVGEGNGLRRFGRACPKWQRCHRGVWLGAGCALGAADGRLLPYRAGQAIRAEPAEE